MPKKSDKFQVGEALWLKGDPFRRPQRWTEYQVVERTPRGYVIRQTGARWDGRPYEVKTISTVRANRDYVSTQDKEDSEWSDVHKYRVLHEVQYGPPAMLRQVARLIGYDEAALEADIAARDEAAKVARAQARAEDDRISTATAQDAADFIAAVVPPFGMIVAANGID